MWLWKSQGTRFPVLIILEHSEGLMNGLAAKMLVLIILAQTSMALVGSISRWGRRDL